VACFDAPNLLNLPDDVGHRVHDDVGFAVENHDARADDAALIVGRQRRQLPGIVITDLIMPNISGLELSNGFARTKLCINIDYFNYK
jgi:FixJ family two-component response regulator